jgi:UDP-glucose 4-epimerase
MGIVVTGGAGFIGRHLLARLATNRAAFGEADEAIVVIDNLRRASTDGLRGLINEGAVRFIEADVRDAAALAEAMQGADYVFHLAAQSNVMGAEADPEYAFSTNVDGTHRVLQAAQAAGARRVVVASSREVYGQPSAIPVPETAALAPKNTYGASKAAAEMSCRVAALRGGLEVVALRLANVYGPGDSGRVIPLWLERAARGEELVVYGGNQVMDLIWVDAVVVAFLRAALLSRADIASAGLAVDTGAGVFAALNVGSGQGTPLAVLIEHIRVLVNHQVTVRTLAARPAEVERFVADTTLMRAVLGVHPEALLSKLHVLAEEAIRRVHGVASAVAPSTGAERHPRLTLVTRDGA